ncbi:MAG: hypothetical protein KC501_36075 [Myxococcales bacterium]|nr:hypothetical protein [Myxococcales bacterium]
MRRRLAWMVVPWLAVACAEDDGMMMATALEGSSGDASSGGVDGASGSAGSDAADDSTGAAGDTGPAPEGLLLRTSFVIPAATVVQEFSFSAPLASPPTLLSGETVVVAVRDLSHPERDQDALCPAYHPLEGCATVDYGAFGTTHDNRLTFEGPDGPWAIHLYKDRSLRLETEPLPANE